MRQIVVIVAAMLVLAGCASVNSVPKEVVVDCDDCSVKGKTTYRHHPDGSVEKLGKGAPAACRSAKELATGKPSNSLMLGCVYTGKLL